MSSDNTVKNDSFINEDSACRNVLVFHKLTGSLSFGSTNYSPKRMCRLLGSLTDNGYQFVSVSELMSHNDSSKIAITFDDGYAHLAAALPPLIDRYKIKPTIFMPTSYVGKNNSWDYSSLFKSEPHLSRQQIEYLSEIGVDFGSHGHRHVGLSSLDDKALDSELSESKNILEEITRKPVETMSFPFGKTNSRVLAAAQKAGYKSSFTMSFPDNSDLNLAMGRVPVYFFDSPDSVMQKLGHTGLYPFHKALCRSATALSVGTVLLNKFLGRP